MSQPTILNCLLCELCTDEEKFISAVTHMIKSKEGIKYKVKAQWATEDKMRDVLKLREHRACIK